MAINDNPQGPFGPVTARHTSGQAVVNIPTPILPVKGPVTLSPPAQMGGPRNVPVFVRVK